MPILFMVFFLKKNLQFLKEHFLLEVNDGVAGRQRHSVTEAGYAEGAPVL